MSLRFPLLAGLALLACAAGARAQELVAYRASRVIPVSGPEVAPGCVLVKDGRIVQVVEPGQIPPGTRVVDLGTGVLFPGMVDAGTHIGLRRNLVSFSRPVSPEARISDAFEPRADDRESLWAAGFTAFHLLPGDRMAVSGRSAVGCFDADGRVRWLVPDGAVHATCRASTLAPVHAPTSPSGVIEVLEELRASGRPPFDGDGPGWFLATAGTPAEVRLVAGFSPSGGPAQPVLIAPAEACLHPPDWAGGVRGVIFEPLLPELGDRERKAPALSRAAGLPIAFASRGPKWQPGAARISAGIAVFAGLSRQEGWMALSGGAAAMLGVGAECGSLGAGRRADFVLWSADPLDLAARVLVVVVEGKIVLDRRPSEESRT